MATRTEVRIGGSVGRRGANRVPDVRSVQMLLNAHRPLGLYGMLRVDGICGARTLAAIGLAQRRFAGLNSPDGRIDPNGPTLRTLNAMAPAPPRAAEALHALPHDGGPPWRPTAPQPVSKAPAPPRLALPRVGPRRSSTAHMPPGDVVTAAQATQRRWGVPASISIAQWVLESGEGRHMPPGSNNPFGIKARPGQPSVIARTREETRDGRSFYIQASFRRFANLEEAFDAHGRLLANGRAFERARRHLNDPDAYADALTHTYATDTHYGSLLKHMMQSRDLYRYNLTAGPSTAPPG